MIIGVCTKGKGLERQIPKYVLTLEEVNFALGSEQLVKDLRSIRALQGKKRGQRLEFPTAEVAKVSAEYFAGKYDEQILKLNSKG